jgi:hypothetical protein
MKIFFPILFFLTSCAEYNHEVRYSPDGTDSVVYVRYYDGQQFNTFYMQYEEFTVIRESQGYEGCYYYYREHQLPQYWLKEYSKYKRK